MEMILTGMQEDARERFAAAVTAHRHAMYRAARALLDSDADAEDAVSEATLRAWQAFGRLREERALKGWLIKITVNCAYEHLRKGARVTLSLIHIYCHHAANRLRLAACDRGFPVPAFQLPAFHARFHPKPCQLCDRGPAGAWGRRDHNRL